MKENVNISGWKYFKQMLYSDSMNQLDAHTLYKRF